MFPIYFATHSVNRFGLIDGGFAAAAKFAKGAGFDGLELTETIHTLRLGPTQLKKIAGNYDLPIAVIHQATPRIVWSTFGAIERLASRAQAMGVSLIVVHIGSIRRSFENENYFKRLKSLEEKYGLTIAFENAMAQTRQFRSVGRSAAHDPVGFLKLADKHDLYLTYDVGHMAPVMADLNNYVQKVGPRLKHLHLHDARGLVDHLPLGQGNLPWVDLIKYLIDNHYVGPITLEVFPYNTAPFLSRARSEEIVRESLWAVKKITQTHGKN
jgi:sugar phosphate isomerase/epimerase